MSAGELIAIDWGTTNRCVYAMRGDGTVITSSRDDRGVTAVAPDEFAGEIEAIRKAYGDLPIIAAGMVGSNRGLQEVPYCAAPATLADLAAGAVEALDRVHVVPGVSLSGEGRSDVMRGEEVQVAGSPRRRTHRRSSPVLPARNAQQMDRDRR